MHCFRCDMSVLTLTHSLLFTRGYSQLCEASKSPHIHTHNYSLSGECNPGNSRVMLFVLCVFMCLCLTVNTPDSWVSGKMEELLTGLLHHVPVSSAVVKRHR